MFVHKESFETPCFALKEKQKNTTNKWPLNPATKYNTVCLVSLWNLHQCISVILHNTIRIILQICDFIYILSLQHKLPLGISSQSKSGHMYSCMYMSCYFVYLNLKWAFWSITFSKMSFSIMFSFFIVFLLFLKCENAFWNAVFWNFFFFFFSFLQHFVFLKCCYMLFFVVVNLYSAISTLWKCFLKCCVMHLLATIQDVLKITFDPLKLINWSSLDAQW